jgi:hypothetical protein
MFMLQLLLLLTGVGWISKAAAPLLPPKHLSKHLQVAVSYRCCCCWVAL